MTDRDLRNRIGLYAIIVSITLGASAATDEIAAEPRAETGSGPAESQQTRRYRFRLLPLESGDRHVLLA